MVSSKNYHIAYKRALFDQITNVIHEFSKVNVYGYRNDCRGSIHHWLGTIVPEWASLKINTACYRGSSTSSFEDINIYQRARRLLTFARCEWASVPRQCYVHATTLAKHSPRRAQAIVWFSFFLKRQSKQYLPVLFVENVAFVVVFLFENFWREMS